MKKRTILRLKRLFFDIKSGSKFCLIFPRLTTCFSKKTRFLQIFKIENFSEKKKFRGCSARSSSIFRENSRKNGDFLAFLAKICALFCPGGKNRDFLEKIPLFRDFPFGKLGHFFPKIFQNFGNFPKLSKIVKKCQKKAKKVAKNRLFPSPGPCPGIYMTGKRQLWQIFFSKKKVF